LKDVFEAGKLETSLLSMAVMNNQSHRKLFSLLSKGKEKK